MTSPRPWPLLDSVKLQDCKVFGVYADSAEAPRTGGVHRFFRLEAGDWINVVPVTPAGEVVLVRQYRHGSRSLTWEIPGGMVDPGESPAAAAARELREETGYGGGELVPLGYVNPNPALFANRCHTFLAQDVVRVGEPEHDGTEDIEVDVVSRAGLDALVAAGQIDHALVITALYWYDRHTRALPCPGDARGTGDRG